MIPDKAQKIIDFWFKETPFEKRFKSDQNFDQLIKDKFLKDYELASQNEYDDWQDQPMSCLALVIIFDQFSRNIFRNDKKAFEQDHKTRLIVNEGVDRGYLEELSQTKIHFFLMPLIHSEDLSDHVFGHNLIDVYLKTFEHYDKIKKAWNHHTVPIKKFGRYPHRNHILNRKSTIEEKEFLDQPNSSW